MLICNSFSLARIFVCSLLLWTQWKRMKAKEDNVGHNIEHESTIEFTEFGVHPL